MVAKKKIKKKKKVGKKVLKKNTKKLVAKKSSKVTRKKTAKKISRKKVTKKATKKKVAKKTSKKTAGKKTTKKVSKKKVVKKATRKKAPRAKVAKAKKNVNKVRLGKNIVSLKVEKKIESTKNVESKDILKETLDFLRTFNFLASDSDECLERKCDNPATTGGYCRLHYIKNWKEIKNKEQILKDGILIDCLEQLINKFSLKVVDSLVEDMSDEKNFYNALKNMNIDVSEEFFYDTDDSSDDSDIPFETKSKPHLYGDD